MDTQAAGQADPVEAGVKRGLPAWLLSLTLHASVLTALAVSLRFTPRGVALEPDRNVGIVLVHEQESEREYFDGEQDSDDQTNDQVTSQSPVLPVEQAVKPIDLAGVLPSLDEPIVGDADEFLPDANDMTTGSAGGRLGNEGSAQTEVFGITGTGSRFVYVFDRSGSMDGYGGRPMSAAKAELLASLEDLEDTHQFQIIFYNERPSIFTIGGVAPKLYYADKNNKRDAQRFVGKITSSGGTQHMDALRMALGMNPDVVFFLTDAAEPQLSPNQLARVHRMNRGAAIHCIEFGYGLQLHRDNFLMRLARENGGEHAYVDISRRRPPK